ncbi:MAG: PrsW family intramembrane metalloprotease [Deltaproteobacteria bacterium]|nr:PrsW family intramembrane metalloprotease [Deltaproteobacteria bacterium]
MELLIQLALLAASAVCAVAPMVLLLVAVWWLDRYTREPVWIVGLTFLWGGIGAVLLALVFNTGLDFALGALVGWLDERMPTDLSWVAAAAGPVVVAPLIEEPAKAIFLLFVLWNRHFDDMADGFLYGAAAGLGFGMTENFLYFAQTSQDPGVWMQTVLIRTAYSAVMHATATSIVGAAAAFGWFRERAALVASLAVGIPLAMAIHGLWNGILTAGDLGGFGDQALDVNLILLPLEVLGVLAVWQLCLWEESRTIRRELAEEASGGRLPAGHPERLASWWSRAWVTDWIPPGVDRALYLDTATSLAMRKS